MITEALGKIKRRREGEGTDKETDEEGHRLGGSAAVVLVSNGVLIVVVFEEVVAGTNGATAAAMFAQLWSLPDILLSADALFKGVLVVRSLGSLLTASFVLVQIVECAVVAVARP